MLLKIRLIILVLFQTVLCREAIQCQQVAMYADHSIPQVQIITEDIQKAIGEDIPVQKKALSDIKSAGNEISIIFFLRDNKSVKKSFEKHNMQFPEIHSEGFCIKKTRVSGKSVVWVTATDPAGLLYGGFELSEQIRHHGIDQVREKTMNPYMAMRGTKFNIPLDARTPTYTDPGEAAQVNMPEMWNFDFWKTYIDNLARHRYNFISLWSLHPFPSMVKVPEYPAIALDDVMISNGYEEKIYTLSGRGYDSPELMNNLVTIKKISIDEKITYWKEVMAYAKERNICFYIVTWNIFTNGTFGKYGITSDPKNPVTIDYFRKSVKQLFLTYPDLAGIGLTTGENIPGATFSEKEDWAFQTYGMGVLDAAKELPDRKITFIHRQHEAKVEEISETFKPLVEHENIDFIFSFKYAQAHVYSSVNQPFKDDFVKDIQKSSALKTIWTLRNDDNYYFRWGAPDFVRDFINNIPLEVSQGYYFGSDGYVWGRDFTGLYPQKSNQLDIEKHWYSWMLWGRLGYDPDYSNEEIAMMIQEKFPGLNAGKFFTALQEASMIYPLTTGFHWGALDFQWYIEGCRSRNVEAKTFSGYHDMNAFISHRTHPGTDYLTIPEYVDGLKSGDIPKGTTPFEIAQTLHTHADSALSILNELKCDGNFEVWQWMEDIRAMAFLGKYYAHKINAATFMEMFRTSFDQENHRKCWDELQKSAFYWRNYASVAASLYKNPQWFNRVGVVDWRTTWFDVLHEMIAVDGRANIPSMPPAEGGVILEAEEGINTSKPVINNIKGYTGAGYLNLSEYTLGNECIEWEYLVPGEGIYMFEIRYINKNNPKPFLSKILVNDEFAGDIQLWGTGNNSGWCSDRIYLPLKAGKNKIRFYPNGELYIDHLNVVSLNKL